MVTAELALVIPALVLVTGLCVWSVGAATAHLRCLDAARGGARELARGELVDRVRELTAQRAPQGARVEVLDRGDGVIAVRVQVRVAMTNGWPRGPAITVGGAVVAAAEQVATPWPP